MMSTYSGCWLVYVEGGLPGASYWPNSSAFSCWPSPCASTERKWPRSGALIGCGGSATAVPHEIDIPTTTPTKKRLMAGNVSGHGVRRLTVVVPPRLQAHAQPGFVEPEPEDPLHPRAVRA